MIEKAILGHIYGNISVKKKDIDIEKNNTDLIVHIQPGKCMWIDANISMKVAP